MVSSTIFGLLSALTWGAGDFCGGLATKRAHPYTVVLVAEFVGAVVLAALALLFREALPGGTGPCLGWAGRLAGRRWLAGALPGAGDGQDGGRGAALR